MSASLVGSEMCIRDRLLRPLPAARGQPPPGQGLRPGGLAPTSRTRSRPCLLYTSDAADDM
eukprot:13762131-Alexandrium_andersonii.AAC.1